MAPPSCVHLGLDISTFRLAPQFWLLKEVICAHKTPAGLLALDSIRIQQFKSKTLLSSYERFILNKRIFHVYDSVDFLTKIGEALLNKRISVKKCMVTFQLASNFRSVALCFVVIYACFCIDAIISCLSLPICCSIHARILKKKCYLFSYLKTN